MRRKPTKPAPLTAPAAPLSIRPRSNLTFLQAVEALATHRPYRLIRTFRDLDDVVHTRELQHADNGEVSACMDLRPEHRHLTVEDIQATTWQEVIG